MKGRPMRTRKRWCERGREKAEELLRRIIAEGRFEPDGDTYIPAPTVEEYNQKYGTDYEVGDTDFNL